ncbi:unnamed protein product [Closterium sp. Naga37s-1]|nr:unnamed protein product [Closterium sp. Naga37s-1]
MLQRIYGTAWESEAQLLQYRQQVEEAKRRDHRRLGKELGLFSIQSEAQLLQYRQQVEEAKRRDHRRLGKELGLFSIQLLQYQQQVEEAKRRDHRRLGKASPQACFELTGALEEGAPEAGVRAAVASLDAGGGLVFWHLRGALEEGAYEAREDAGGGLVFWHPRGARVRAMIEEHWRKEHLRRGYELLYTPHMAKLDLWKTSGHYEFYRENMFDQLLYTPHMAKLDLWKTSGHYEFYRENMFDQMEVEEEHYQIRPMNCPFHIMLYNDSLHSYRDLPIRCDRPMNCPFHIMLYNDSVHSYRDLPIRWVPPHQVGASPSGGRSWARCTAISAAAQAQGPSSPSCPLPPSHPPTSHALRWAELGTVYRYERSGTMHGLFRVRGFTQVGLTAFQVAVQVRGFTQDDAYILCLPSQNRDEMRGVLDLTEAMLTHPHPRHPPPLPPLAPSPPAFLDDAHIFCLPSQIRDEIRGVLDLTEAMLTDFGFQQLEINLSTRPEKSVGDDAIWEQATQQLEINLSTRPEKSVGDDAIWEQATQVRGLQQAAHVKGGGWGGGRGGTWRGMCSHVSWLPAARDQPLNSAREVCWGVWEQATQVGWGRHRQRHTGVLFGFQQLEINLSTRPEKSVGDDAIWEQATQALREALQDKGWDYTVDEGGGAFYGPKIDVKIMDAIGRKWQCSTIQVDFNLPHRFNMVYADADGTRRPPIMIHRAIFGSLERFFGILIENYAGDFPLWFAPTQLRLLPVTDSEVSIDVRTL